MTIIIVIQIPNFTHCATLQLHYSHYLKIKFASRGRFDTINVSPRFWDRILTLSFVMWPPYKNELGMSPVMICLQLWCLLLGTIRTYHHGICYHFCTWTLDGWMQAKASFVRSVAHQTLALWTNSIFQEFSTMMDLAKQESYFGFWMDFLLFSQSWTIHYIVRKWGNIWKS